METSKQRIEKMRKKRAEYKLMRESLMKIVESEKTTDSDRINAIKTIMEMDNQKGEYYHD